jgi:hypothetical protein
MRALVLYRSFYGNTRHLAETISEALVAEGHEATTRDVRQKLPDLESFDLIAVGSPTRIKRASGRAKRAIRALRRRGWGRRLVAVFDTYGPVPSDPAELEKGKKWLYPGAAGDLEKVAAKAGLRVHRPSLRWPVTGMEGPLEEGYRVRAVDFARGIANAAQTRE